MKHFIVLLFIGGSALAEKLAISEEVTKVPVEKQHEYPEYVLARLPTLEVDGKRVVVSAQKYLEHHLKSAKGKYALIGVPDG